MLVIEENKEHSGQRKIENPPSVGRRNSETDPTDRNTKFHPAFIFDLNFVFTCEFQLYLYCSLNELKEREKQEEDERNV